MALQRTFKIMLTTGTYRIVLILLLAFGVSLGCSGTPEKTDQASSPIPKPSRPVITYSSSLSDSTIMTFAGGGVGDGGLAVEASLYTPQSIAVDSEGNIYICDTGHHRIRRVDAKTGIITTVVGTGKPGNEGDHGRAMIAQLSSPHGVAFDLKGNLYISDTENHRIRQLDKRGNLHPAIGKKPNTQASPMPEDHDHSLMFMVEGSGEDIMLAPPHHITIDLERNIYITEMENNRVVKIDYDTKELTVIAGVITAPGYAGDGDVGTKASLMSPHSVAVDTAGNVYIADTLNHRIRMVDSATGIITTIAGNGRIGFSGDGGLATRARLAGPSGIAVSPDGHIYIVDTDNRRIRKLTPFGSDWFINTVAGTGHRGSHGDGGPALEAHFVRPLAVAIDRQENLYISDTGAHKVRKINSSGIITTIAGNGQCCFTGDGQAAVNAEFTPPYGISVDHGGNLYIVDRDNHRIRRISISNAVITTVAGNGSRGYRGDGGRALEASLSDPMSVAISKDESIYIADYGNHRIRKVDSRTGTITTVAGNHDTGFSGDGGEATKAQLHFPAGVALDANGNLYISDTGNQRIRMVRHDTGAITTIAGTGAYGFRGDGGLATEADLANPTDLSFDQEGNLYVDTGHHLIRIVSLQTGIITSLAGRGWPGLEGDGGPVSKAVLSSPHGIALDSQTLYIADTDNRRIRKVTLPLQQAS